LELKFERYPELYLPQYVHNTAILGGCLDNTFPKFTENITTKMVPIY